MLKRDLLDDVSPFSASYLKKTARLGKALFVFKLSKKEVNKKFVVARVIVKDKQICLGKLLHFYS